MLVLTIYLAIFLTRNASIAYSCKTKLPYIAIHTYVAM